MLQSPTGPSTAPEPPRPSTANSANTFTLSPGKMVGTAVTSRDERGALPSQNPNAWKRQSLPITDAYADMIGGMGSDIQAALAQRQPGDRSSIHSISHEQNNRRRTSYYEDQLQYRDNPIARAPEKVQKDSPVIAELKTNVIIKDEFTLVTDLSHQLASRYSRSGAAIMVKVDHSACLALGGTFDPCYMLTLTAVPSQSGPLSNRRNAAAIQSFMADILSVPADRGIIKFETIGENNIATNGNTLAGQNELMERQSHEGTQIAMKRAITSASRKSVPTFKHSVGRMDPNEPLPNGQGMTPLAQKRKSMGATSQSHDVFELPTEFERPSTSHGQSSSHAFDGLRMNGVSREDLVGKNARLPNGRPKTIAAQPDVPRTATVPKFVQRNVSNRTSQPLGAPASRAAAANRLALPNNFKPEQKSLSHVATLTKADARANRPRDSYMDSESVSRDSSLKRQLDRPDYKLDARAAEKYANSSADTSSIISGKDTTANIAKRRSTITATPKMPAPPPIPESKPKEPKVGKRKSFLAAFRRSTVGA